jgi:hypothetical protein
MSADHPRDPMRRQREGMDLLRSLARRRLRATAAIAGIAAAGVGIAVPALAAPAPGPDGVGTAPTAPNSGSSPNVVHEVPTAPVADLSDLPPLFTFEAPRVHTADTTLQPPAVPQDVPSLSHAGDVVGFDESNDVEFDVQSTAPQDQMGALQHPDAASAVAGLAEQVLSSTQGNDIRP